MRVPSAAVFTILLSAAGLSSAGAKSPDISDSTLLMTSIADATVSAKRCGFSLNSDQVLADMLASSETFDSFAGQGFGDDIKAAEAAARSDKTSFCSKAMLDYGPSGNKYKNLLR